MDFFQVPQQGNHGYDQSAVKGQSAERQQASHRIAEEIAKVVENVEKFGTYQSRYDGNDQDIPGIIGGVDDFVNIFGRRLFHLFLPDDFVYDYDGSSQYAQQQVAGGRGEVPLGICRKNGIIGHNASHFPGQQKSNDCAKKYFAG